MKSPCARTYCEALVQHTECSAERKADTLKLIAYVRDWHS
ncbi:Uncharacterised protein [Pseudomonas fluorescens]|uniref:Uncharacterized protein n=1 Tax=Pseudomonas fluorescens TaxID=294 RepID=A0A379ID43_PSEFL|nr:Uncharacterised protein [Pseudomonas fluorescens]